MKRAKACFPVGAGARPPRAEPCYHGKAADNFLKPLFASELLRPGDGRTPASTGNRKT